MALWWIGRGGDAPESHGRSGHATVGRPPIGVPTVVAALVGLSRFEADGVVVGANQVVGPQLPPVLDPMGGFDIRRPHRRTIVV